ncbi:MAG: S-adenosylmethionine synthase [Candidatus Woesebacteria bacterium GW2011_GWB1_38_5]|uniref:methionine adenosyltransferase n=1 Tax=Candidatus Woesebacteria bacterium GW2011_GWB1_38_5 TaxID=1618568 RepID=A0A0G0MPN0_9BACT|nr:MAG: S-adenosylmethionine synthase [Candidatus Woesebacteria bacterium GW2011_GWB1_38_5]
MKNLKYETYTVESVTSGHPDKICDQVSDAILDACLIQDPKSRVAMECMGAHGAFYIGGELTTSADINPVKIAKNVYNQIGYTDKLKVTTNIVRQSADISQGVDTGGAGDQGIMKGYATSETPTFLPLEYVLARDLCKKIYEKDEDLSEYARKHFDFRPLSIIEELNLRQPIYRDTASYGHFGRDGFPWEKLEEGV